MTKRKRDDHGDIKEDRGMRMMIKSRRMMPGIMRTMEREKKRWCTKGL